MAQTAVGDLVVNLDVNSSKFNEQMEYVKGSLSRRVTQRMTLL